MIERIEMQSRPEPDFVCYECVDGAHEDCLGVPCHCPCPCPVGEGRAMSPENEARAKLLEEKFERAEIVWATMLAENARLREENAHLRAVTGALMDGDGGRAG